jgi:hypothetical protein
MVWRCVRSRCAFASLIVCVDVEFASRYAFALAYAFGLLCDA